MSWNAVSWSISAEFFTYIAFALLLLISRGRPAMFIGASSLAVLLSFFFVWEHGLYPLGAVSCVYSFFIGVLTFNLYGQLTRAKRSVWVHACALAVALALSIPALQHGNHVVLAYPWLFACFILCLLLAPEHGVLKKLLANRFLVYLGTISYGIYMIHLAVGWALRQVMRVVWQWPVDGDGVVVVGNGYVAIAVAVVYIAIVLCLAHWSYLQVEMPVNRFKNRLARL